MTRAVSVSLAAIVSVISNVPRAEAQASAQRQPTTTRLVAQAKNPYIGIFRNASEPFQAPTVSSRRTPTIVCGTTVFRGDPNIDARIGAAPMLDAGSRKPTPKARIIEPKTCVEESSSRR